MPGGVGVGSKSKRRRSRTRTAVLPPIQAPDVRGDSMESGKRLHGDAIAASSTIRESDGPKLFEVLLKAFSGISGVFFSFFISGFIIPVAFLYTLLSEFSK